MNRPIAEHFTNIARAMLPGQADIPRANQGGDLRLVTAWRVETDRRRPNKRSKSLELRISRKVTSDYAIAIPGRKGRLIRSSRSV